MAMGAALTCTKMNDQPTKKQRQKRGPRPRKREAETLHCQNKILRRNQ
jgi:hypothetical protein